MTPHEQLEKFFAEFLKLIKLAEPSTYGSFLLRAEQEFQRLGYREEISAGVENILVVRFDAIGDMILTSGFLRELRKNFPHARITLLVFTDVRSVAELCPYVNEVLNFDRELLNGNFIDVLERIVVFCRNNLWRKHFSIAFSPRWHDDTFYLLLMVWLSGACERIGYSTRPFNSWLGDPPADLATRDNLLINHIVVTPRSVVADAEKNFYLLQAVGLAVEQTHMELWFDAADTLRACELLKNIPTNCKKVLLCIGSRELNKKYPVEKYLVALKILAKKNLTFIIVGGKDELDDADYLEKNLPHGKVLNLVGKTTLRETEAITAQMDYYLGNDTSVMHMAAAAQIPVLVLYREAADMEDVAPGFFSGYGRFPPYQTNAVVLRPDHQLEECANLPPVHAWCHAPVAHCITQITPQEIVDGFEQLERMT